VNDPATTGVIADLCETAAKSVLAQEIAQAWMKAQS